MTVGKRQRGCRSGAPGRRENGGLAATLLVLVSILSPDLAAAGDAVDAPRCPSPPADRSGALWWDPCPQDEPETASTLPLPVAGASMVFLPTAAEGCGADAAMLGKYELTVGQAAAILAGDPETGAASSLAEGLQALADRYDDGAGKAKSEAVAPVLWRLRSLSFGVWNTPEGDVALSVRQHLARPVVGLSAPEVEALADHYTRWCYRNESCRARIEQDGERRLLRLPTDREWSAAAGEPPEDADLAATYANLDRSWSELRADEAPVGVGRAPTEGGFYDLFGNVAELTGGRDLALRGGSFASAAKSGVEQIRRYEPYAFDPETGSFLGPQRSVEAGVRLALASIGPQRCGVSIAGAEPAEMAAPSLADAAPAFQAPAAPTPQADLSGPELADRNPVDPRVSGELVDPAPPRDKETREVGPSVVEASGLKPPSDAAADAAGIGRLRDSARVGRVEEEARLRGAEAERLRTSLRALESEKQSLKTENQTLADETAKLRAAEAARRTRLCSALAENMFLSARFQIRYWRQYHKLEPILAELETMRPTDPAYYDELIEKYATQKGRLEGLAERVFARYLRAAEAMAEQGASCAAEGFSEITAMGLEGEAAAADDAPASSGAETAMLARAHAVAAAEAARKTGTAESAIDAELAQSLRAELMERGRILAAETE